MILRGGAAAGLSLLLPGCFNDGSNSENCVPTISGATGNLPQSDVVLHAVEVGYRSTRLTYSSVDNSGFLWAGSVNPVLNRYNPLTGQLDIIPHPFDAVVSHCVCMGDKVYMLGQRYPSLMVYDQLTAGFSELAYPVLNPNIWYGVEEFFGPVDGRHMYLFDQGSRSVIKWDTFTDSATVIGYPYPTPAPYIGRYIPSDNAIWCNLWDFSDGQYVPVGISRLDVTTDTFTDFFPFPDDDAGLAPYSNPADTIFYQWSFQGKLRPFDVSSRRFCQFLEVPGFGQTFGWIGMSSVYQERWYFTLSTYNGSELGIDCKPYHFLNSLLEFDPVTGRFAYPTLEYPDAYYQISYILRAGNEFYATCNNILKPDGGIDLGNEGELIFWQSITPL